MDVLLVHRYFWPDTPPYASILLEIAKHLSREGHTVTVLSTYPSYKSANTRKDAPAEEILDGVKIKRINIVAEDKFRRFAKLANLIYFPLRVFFHIICRRKTEVVMCSTSPVITMGLFAAFGAKLANAKFVYHCMDIYPEIGRISGEFRQNLLFRVLLKLDSLSCRLASRVVVLSKDMKTSIQDRPGTSYRPNGIEIINNFPIPIAHDANSNHVHPNLLKKDGMFRVIFAGNIGRFQRLDAFVDAMALISDYRNIELVFLGEGAALGHLQSMVSNKNLSSTSFIPHQEVQVARQIISDSDLGVVSLLNDVYKFAFPSKTMTYLDEGCPILLTIEKDSQLRQLVDENELGYCADPGDSESISKAIVQAYADRGNSKGIKIKCREYVRDNYSQEILSERWKKLFKSLESADE